MARSPSQKFSARSKACADTLRSCWKAGLSERAIAAKLCAAGFHVSNATIHRRITDLRVQAGGPRKLLSPRSKKLTPRTKRWLCRQVRVSGVRTTRMLHHAVLQHGLEVSRQTVLRALQSIQTLRYTRPKKCIPLTRRHKAQRLRWARQCLSVHIDWSKALFADEKVWYLDGPTVRPKLWQDIRDPPQLLPRTGARNRSVYIWGAISCDFVPDIVCVPSVFNAGTYCQILSHTLVPHPTIQQYTLFHDRHPVHTAARTDSWLRQQHIRTELLPAKGADMNPIENVWGWLSATVFPQNKTYSSTEALVTAIRHAWQHLQADRVLRCALIDSMPNRLGQVVDKKGAWTKY